jgi:hypothetical protein
LKAADEETWKIPKTENVDIWSFVKRVRKQKERDSDGIGGIFTTEVL